MRSCRTEDVGEIGAKEGKTLTKEATFKQLVPQYERRILGFILTLVPHFPDAEDLLQETLSVMWRKFDDFELGTDFGAWGITIARFHVLDHRRRLKSKRVYFSESLSRELAEAAENSSVTSDLRAEALRSCLARLSDSDHELVRMRYYAEKSAKEISQRLGRSADSVYKSLNRIHHRLSTCIRYASSGQE